MIGQNHYIPLTYFQPYQRQSGGTAAPEHEFKNKLIGGCHARLVGCSSFNDEEFSLFNDICKARGWNPLDLTRTQMIEVLEEVLRVAERPTPEESQRRKAFLLEVTPERLALIRQWVARRRDGKCGPPVAKTTEGQTSLVAP